MEPSWKVKSSDGSHVAAYELGGSGEVLLIAHATGLCGAMYQLLADQLTDMIVAQRAYQANTKIISTADNLLDQLNQILR